MFQGFLHWLEESEKYCNQRDIELKNNDCVQWEKGWNKGYLKAVQDAKEFFKDEFDDNEKTP